MNKKKFREKLQDIANKYICSEQTQAIFELYKTYSHFIKVVEEAIQGKPETFKYNCFMYAFNINHKNPNSQIMLILKREFDKNSETEIFFTIKFIDFYLTIKCLHEISFNKIGNDDIIIYFDENSIPLHAGKIKNGRVISKWGLSGNLYEHSIWEVPIKYGTDVKYFEGISEEDSIKYFIEYAKTQVTHIP
ncbi:MAG: hypothetical protein A2539_09000 [Elusimicrobia bacterium RIFOXYD2_FULL_34_15]|nr:MAG: hypothetical protein A2539_09000 [Elusimicrobia bacterium RIFOXYD2_FULL_34_15]